MSGFSDPISTGGYIPGTPIAAPAEIFESSNPNVRKERRKMLAFLAEQDRKGRETREALAAQPVPESPTQELIRLRSENELLQIRVKELESRLPLLRNGKAAEHAVLSR
jgi:hypothetical protein